MKKSLLTALMLFLAVLVPCPRGSVELPVGPRDLLAALMSPLGNALFWRLCDPLFDAALASPADSTQSEQAKNFTLVSISQDPVRRESGKQTKWARGASRSCPRQN